MASEWYGEVFLIWQSSALILCGAVFIMLFFVTGVRDSFFNLNSMTYFERAPVYYKMGSIIANCTFSAIQVQALLKLNTSFDVIVLEEFLTPALMGLSYVYNVPVVYVSAMISSCWNNDFFGNPSPLSYIPNLLTQFSQRMSFTERLQNAIFDTYNKLYRHLVF